jgi:hypothetical protein
MEQEAKWLKELHDRPILLGSSGMDVNLQPKIEVNQIRMIQFLFSLTRRSCFFANQSCDHLDGRTQDLILMFVSRGMRIAYQRYVQNAKRIIAYQAFMLFWRPEGDWTRNSSADRTNYERECVSQCVTG